MLEETLLPMVRTALRHGRGHRHLLAWVQQTLPGLQGTGADRSAFPPEAVAEPMTRLLCQALLDEMRTRPQRNAPSRSS